MGLRHTVPALLAEAGTTGILNRFKFSTPAVNSTPALATLFLLALGRLVHQTIAKVDNVQVLS
jgi:hypothetical protein